MTKKHTYIVLILGFIMTCCVFFLSSLFRGIGAGTHASAMNYPFASDRTSLVNALLEVVKTNNVKKPEIEWEEQEKKHASKMVV